MIDPLALQPVIIVQINEISGLRKLVEINIRERKEQILVIRDSIVRGYSNAD